MGRFPCLFALETDKLCKVSDRHSPLDWKWSWRRSIRSGVEDQQMCELASAIDHVTYVDSRDKWVCSSLSNELFYVNEFRNLMDRDSTVRWPTHWCKVVPPNINFFLWCALLNRLPDKCSLFEKGAIQDISCPSCTNFGEELQHIFFECYVASQVWSFISSWLDMVLPIWQSVDDL
ncbi:uncharacterized protein [Rutidosis leptorrhynchoides]|uniref:uncharacterized protein n=1 Tax=Rutidosis leptorrhynchoides TaxID=125765 RepID=UPI003A994313